jgi:hypothetical protein
LVGEQRRDRGREKALGKKRFVARSKLNCGVRLEPAVTVQDSRYPYNGTEAPEEGKRGTA